MTIKTNTANANTSTSWLTSFENWSTPERVDVIDTGNSIEMVYVQYSICSVWAGSHHPIPSSKRVFKIVYSCKNGQWHKSDPIYGTIVPAQKEYYEFEQ